MPSPSSPSSSSSNSPSCGRPSGQPCAGAPPLLRLEIAAKAYRPRPGLPGHVVLRDFHLEVAAGEVVALVGPSGCGKTTALNIAAGLDRDFTGRVELARGVRLGYVFQTPRLLPWRTLRHNVRLALPCAERDSGRAEALLDLVGLAEAVDKYPGELSGGMQRRGALARLFALDADLLLLDEPFVSLDQTAARQLRGLLADHLAERGRSALLVTHDRREALELADRLLMVAGPPAAVTGELRVDLPRAARTPAAIERLHAANWPAV